LFSYSTCLGNVVYVVSADCAATSAAVCGRCQVDFDALLTVTELMSMNVDLSEWVAKQETWILRRRRYLPMSSTPSA